MSDYTLNQSKPKASIKRCNSCQTILLKTEKDTCFKCRGWAEIHGNHQKTRAVLMAGRFV